MTQAFFGGSGVGSSTTRSAYTITSGPISLVGGRLAANGGTYAMMGGLAALVSGYSSTVSLSATLGGGTAAFSVTATGGLPTSYAGNSTNGWLFNGGSYNLVLVPSAQLRFNRGAGGSTSDSNGTSFGANTIGGYYEYYLPPTAPQSLSGVPHPTASGSVQLSWSAPADFGGLALQGYTVYRNGVQVGTTTGTTFTDTGLTSGLSYTYVVRARNAVTTAAGTQSVSSNTISVEAPGVPTPPQSLSATPSASVTGRIALSWAAPVTPGAGGITGYTIFRDFVQIATTTGTGTTFNVNSLTPYTTYTFAVRARNAFADANSTYSLFSNYVDATAPGPPSAPSGLTATPDGGTPGKIDLSWTAPVNTGTGGITGYNIRFSNGTLVHATTGTGTTYSVTGLNPGQTYTFRVHARNSLADAEASESVASNNAVATALGEPIAPTSFLATASTIIPGRITLTWAAPGGTLTGYSIFDRNTTTSVDTLIAVVSEDNTTFKIDGLAGGVPKTYRIRARNSYTDTLPTGYPGNYGGTASATSTATPNADYARTVPSLAAVTDSTNQIFNGTFVVTGITPTTFSYAKTAANIVSVPVSAGSVTNNTNAALNGTYTIATPSATTITYAKTAPNLPPTSMAGGVVANNTNVTFNGTKIITAVNVGAKTLTYDRTGTAVSTVAVPTNTPPGAQGTVTNQTNAIFNGADIPIVSVPSNTTLTYAKTNANLSESNAAGTVTNQTNIEVFNGVFPVVSTPAYNSFTYEIPGWTGSGINLATNPKLATNTTGWTVAGSNSGGTDDDRLPITGLPGFDYAYVRDYSAGLLGDNARVYHTMSGLTAGTYTISAWCKASGTGTFTLRLATGTNGTTGVTAGTQVTVPSDGAWHRVSFTTDVASPGTYYLHLHKSGSSAAGYMAITGVLFEETDDLHAYYDGDFEDGSLYTYAWTSTANNSTSTKTALSYSRAILAPYENAYRFLSPGQLDIQYRSGWAG